MNKELRAVVDKIKLYDAPLGDYVEEVVNKPDRTGISFVLGLVTGLSEQQVLKTEDRETVQKFFNDSVDKDSI